MQDDILAQIIGEAGPFDPEIQAIYQMPDNGVGWAIRYDLVDIRVENRPDEGRVIFSTLIDGPQPDMAADAFRALLAANALWRDNGGLRFAIASDQDHIELSIPLPEGEVTPRAVAGYARSLASHALDWSALFKGNLTDDLGDEAADAFDPDMIRL